MSQTTGGIPDTLVALDWHGVTCQSESGCTNQATYIVSLHAVDRCNHPQLDPFGNVIEILCIACLWRAEAEVLCHVSRMRRHAETSCLTCGAPVAELSDIMRDVVAL
ncbi:hypothetical protein BST27_26520 [Mycobacterium intermedium]|uniref:Uncharacterized protein n=2 Tax=Mycobacterium TaxID=1763 RepID=A0A1E3S4V9_MYCIE|nr:MULTISPECIES: hypothetical protein [Mycobacterium]MCV6966933.1 hypothetical protein [Mycobacterium intermedium]MCV6975023.1 hypothetical protein [Mycobacterium bourgelatii]ODQ97205.1 hypothetical protein BHQ20_27395 [Mycobacterium intermedium]OPE47133.1 hypothetical protein BV508_23280 [Mycobacterium intermedium]ORA95680.1 hypothetical protein BST27_26520 [Mycobacterium intermedium]